jgi:hypothetical protein
MLMPWISSGFAVHHVPYVPPAPQTMPTVPWLNPDGKTALSLLNQYWPMAACWVV